MNLSIRMFEGKVAYMSLQFDEKKYNLMNKYHTNVKVDVFLIGIAIDIFISYFRRFNVLLMPNIRKLVSLAERVSQRNFSGPEFSDRLKLIQESS